MAKRRKKTSHRRRRRIGALALNASSPLVKFGSIAVGYFMADKVNEAIDKATGGKIDGKIVAAAEVLAGFMIQKKPGMMTTVIGGVLMGAGAKKGLTEFGVISGFRSIPVVGGYNVPQRLTASVNGIMDVPTVNGLTVPNSNNLIGGIMGDHDLSSSNY